MTPIFLRGTLLLLAFATLAPLPVVAEEPKTLEKIQVESEPEPTETQAATRLPLTLRETPQSVTVISRAQSTTRNSSRCATCSTTLQASTPMPRTPSA